MKTRSILLGAGIAVLLLPAASAQDPIPFVPKESEWKYLDRDILPVPGDPDALDWTYFSEFYDDSTWASGLGQLGFNEGDENTLISRGSSSPFPTTFYFRKTFNVTAGQLNTLEGDDFFYQLIFDILRDDGAIVYLNEIELFRTNVAQGAEFPPNADDYHHTRAIGAVGGSTAESEYHNYVINGDGILVEGENVLAVSVHQNSPGSSDISFDMSMSGVKVAPLFGVYRPPQEIDFDTDEGDTPPTVFKFTPNPFEAPSDLGWEVRSIAGPAGGMPVSYGRTNRDPVSNTPQGGFVDGYACHINNGTALLTTQTKKITDSPLRYRIDLRNHVDVEVSFGVRCDDTKGLEFGAGQSNGFDANDWIKFTHLTSDTGEADDYDETEVLWLRGGAGGGGSNFESVPLVKEPDTKRGLVPTNGNLGLTWTELAFDDSNWHEFTKGLGYDNAATYPPFIGWDTGSLMRGTNGSCYMRIPFMVEDKDAMQALTLYARDDDGFIAYINGERVYDINGPGAPLWNSTAVANNPDGTAVDLKANNITAHLDKLVNGENILAVHCLNQSTGSSDFLVSVELEGSLENQVPRNDPPITLNDVNFGVDGPLYRYTFPVDDLANSYVFECELKTNALDETIYFDNFKITGTPLSVDSYDAWVQLEHPTFVAGESAEELSDPDGDGIVNYLEFAFGSDPEVASLTTPSGDPILPQVYFVEEAGSTYYEIEWRQRDATAFGALDFPYGGYALQGIQYVPQFSSDMELWNDGRFAFQGDLVGEPVDNGDGTLTFRMRYKDPVLTGDLGDSSFYGRLLVTRSVPIIEDGETN